ncbi:MAG: peptidoglycan DD-metalloendopeptidase family protein [Pseudomonadota bacterium]
MKKIRLIFLGLIATAIAGCSTTRNAAPVIDRAPGARAAPVATSKPASAEGRGFYTVKRGDTLYRIASEFRQNFRDIVEWNNLPSANNIEVGQVLRVLPPENGQQPLSGAQTASVATTSGVETRPLNTAVTSSAPSAAASSGNKTGPRGDKRPYSDAALAEMQRPDGAAPVVASRAEPARSVAPKAEEKVSDSPAETSAADSSIAWIWPAEGKVIGTFDGGKKGIDIAGRMGQPIIAAGSGTVLYASSVRGYGNLVIVKHTNNLLSAYAHNKTILVKEGQTVSKGQKIAEMGNSDTDTVKLHFEIRQQGKPVDPSKFLPNR